MSELKLTNQAEKILNSVDLKDRHSYFQLAHFILGKEPTIQAKLWQCVREISPRLETLISLENEMEIFEENFQITEIKIKMIESKIEKLSINSNNEQNILKSEILKIKKKRYERSLSSKEKTKEKILKKKRMIEEELSFFVKNFDELEKVEKIKNWDDFKLQSDIWSAKLGADLNLRFLLNLPTDIELCKTVLSLPESNPVKQQLVTSLKNIQNKIVQIDKENSPNK